ncbi:universal stress protein [Hoeflea sp. TYP-13]|uniref:universal stress protein n=1 Tax=Hoeflea sp. TYP-13 TaxID=3230023 RepID=UPI0034C6D514
MAITTLLTVHLADEPIESVKPVMAFAGEIGAHLNIVVIGIMKTMPSSFYGGVPEFYLTDEHDMTIREAQERAKDVRAMVGEADLSATVLIEYIERGLVAQRMSTHALYSDIAVFPHRSLPNDNATADAFNGVLFKSGVPVLVLGEPEHQHYPFKCAVLGWDFEPQAARAIHRSLPLIADTRDVHVLLVDPDRNPLGSNPGDDIATFLVRHGLPVTVDLVPSAGRDVADVLLRHAVDKDADLLVTGAYGHSRFQEWLLGGTTRDLLSNTKLPVLMAH